MENINMGIKKTQNYMLISNLLMPAFENVPKKSSKQKNKETPISIILHLISIKFETLKPPNEQSG